MQDDPPQRQRLLDLEKRQCDLLEKLSRLEEEHDFETRVENKMRQEKEIADTKARLQLVETEYLTIKQQPLFIEASRLKRIGSFQEAIAIWRDILHSAPSNSMVLQEIAMLEKLAAQQAAVIDLTKNLSRIKEIRPIFKELMALLKQPAGTAEYMALVEQAEFFLTSSEPDTEGFMLWWEEELPSSQPHSQNVDISRLAGRVQRGEIVLFLGSGITSAYGEEDVDVQENALAKLLAKQIGYEQFNGTLSSIAEYYQLHPDYGPSALLENIRSGLPHDMHSVALYQALAKVQAPLILISAAYDSLLECAFRESGKRFVELASIVRRSDEYDIGHVVVSFSDDSQPTTVYPEEQLSRMKFLENGYSIIYKIRGTCGAAECGGDGDDMLRRDALTLSESSYFNFARYADRMIPSYLAKQLRNRGFLFVGYYPRDWEDRLLVNAMLERRNSQELCHVIGATSGPLEAAFWKSRNVEQYHTDIRELEKCLEGVGA
jgi:hypothetical protein